MNILNPLNSDFVKKKVEFITINNHYKKIIFQFGVISNRGIIPGEFVFNRTAYPDRSKAKCPFFHRVIEGFYKTDFDHDIFNADPDQIISLNNKKND